MLESATLALRIPALDLDRARVWYRDKLGLEPLEERPGGLLYRTRTAEFAIYQAAAAGSGTFTQAGWYVEDLDATVAELRERGVRFEDVDAPGLRTTDGIADVEGNYPSKGRGERAAWFRDSEGNLFGLAQLVA